MQMIKNGARKRTEAVCIFISICIYFICLFLLSFTFRDIPSKAQSAESKQLNLFCNLSRMFTIENAIYILRRLQISISLLSPELFMRLDLTFSANMEQLLRTYTEMHVEHSHLVLHLCNGHIYTYIQHFVKKKHSLLKFKILYREFLEISNISTIA